MRRLLTVMVVAATTALMPTLVLAGNQETADQVAKTLRASGQMHDYKIGVKYQDGTVWLKGQVCSDEQAQTAMNLAVQVEGVQSVKNELKVVPATEAKATEAAPTSAPQVAETPAPAEAPQPAVAEEKAPQPVEAPQVVKTEQPAEVQESEEPAPVQLVNATEEEDSPQLTEPMQVAAPAQPQPAARSVPTTYFQPQPAPAPAAVAQPMPVAQPSNGAPLPMYTVGAGGTAAPARYDQPNMPGYAWPSYAAHPNYAAVTYPRQYSPAAWPYIGPFYPYPQVPLGWRKVTLQWDDGWWFLDFKDRNR